MQRLTLIGFLIASAIACHDSTSPAGGLHETAATSLAAGDVSTCALTAAGAAYCWGEDSLGQLGTGERPGAAQTAPVAVGGAHTFVALSGGGELMCALTGAGQSWCWGGSAFTPPTSFQDSLPTSISGSVSLVTISTGPFHSCGLTSGGDAYCWGQNSYGQLGSGDTLAKSSPVIVAGGLKWSAISAGFYHTCGVTTNSKAYCWGDPIFGDLGDPVLDTNHTVAQTTPHAVVGGLSVASISAGSGYTCVVTTTGAGYCWGNNMIGQLGDGTDTSRDAPVPVGVAGLTLAKIFVSRADDVLSTTCGLTTSGAALCWGSDTNGQLGYTATTPCAVNFGHPNYVCSMVPLAVTGGLTFAALAVGDVHVCGVTTAGVVDCWGGNAFGQLGNGTTQDSPTPTPIAGGLHAL